MATRKTDKRLYSYIYVYDKDAKFIEEQLEDELNLPNYADAVHALVEHYKKGKNKEQVQEAMQKELAKNSEERKELKKQLTVIGIKLSTLAELSSDFFYKEEKEHGIGEDAMIGTDCEAWKNAEKKALNRGDVWRPLTSEESRKRLAELEARSQKMIRQIDEALAKGNNND